MEEMCLKDTSLFLCKVLAVILPKIAGKKYLSGQSEKLKHSEHSLEESEILSKKEADEMHGHKKRSTAVLQPLLTLNLIL